MESTWLRCINCGAMFRSPVYRDTCVLCGGDEPHLGPVLAFAALVDVLLLLVWKFL